MRRHRRPISNNARGAAKALESLFDVGISAGAAHQAGLDAGRGFSESPAPEAVRSSLARGIDDGFRSTRKTLLLSSVLLSFAMILAKPT